LDAIEDRVLTPENVQMLVKDTIVQLAETPDEALAAQREQLEARITELDATIRRTAAQVINGLIDEDDAKVLNAPLLAQREQARLELAALPTQRVLPAPDEIDSERFRAEVLRAWHDAPLEDRREALGKLLSEVRLSPGGVTIRYCLAGYQGHDPYGPALEGGERKVGWCAAGVQRTRRHAEGSRTAQIAIDFAVQKE